MWHKFEQTRILDDSPVKNYNLTVGHIFSNMCSMLAWHSNVGWSNQYVNVGYRVSSTGLRWVDPLIPRSFEVSKSNDAAAVLLAGIEKGTKEQLRTGTGFANSFIKSCDQTDTPTGLGRWKNTSTSTLRWLFCEELLATRSEVDDRAVRCFRCLFLFTNHQPQRC